MQTPEIIYVNGVHTKYAEGLRQAEAIEKFTGRHVFLFHNPSATWASSMVESLWNRWLWWLRPAPIVRRLAQFLQRCKVLDTSNINGPLQCLSESVSPSVTAGEEPFIHIVAHSQGTAIANNAVNLLPYAMKKRIRMTLFAPVNSFTVQGVNRVDRFLNKRDYVFSHLFLGNAIAKAISNWQDTRRMAKGLLPLYRGVLFSRNARGHSFIKGYLNEIKNFECYKVSMFWKSKKKG